MSEPHPKPFNKDVSAPADEPLVAFPTAASGNNRPSPPENEHHSIILAVQVSESDDINANPPPECPENDVDNDSEGSTTSENRPLVQKRSAPNAQANRTDANVRNGKRLKIAPYSICLVSLIMLIVLVLPFWIGFGIKYRLSPQFEILSSYTRTGTNALLAAFPCTMTSCDVSEVDIKVVPNAETDQIDYFLTDCSNITYGHLEVHKDYVSSLYDADIPEPIIIEDYLMENYFSGQLSILIQAIPLSLQDEAKRKSELYLCHFVDPVKFDLFLESGPKSSWREYVELSTCKIIEGESLLRKRNLTITFGVQQPSFSFVGAVLTNKSFQINFGYNVMGQEIIAINDSRACSLNVNKGSLAPSCSISVSTKLGTGSKMCVLGNGVSENDGRYQYTKAAVSLKYVPWAQREFLITMIVCSIIVGFLLLKMCLGLICACCLYKHCTIHTSTQVDCETVEPASYEHIIRNQQQNCQ